MNLITLFCKLNLAPKIRALQQHILQVHKDYFALSIEQSGQYIDWSLILKHMFSKICANLYVVDQPKYTIYIISLIFYLFLEITTSQSKFIVFKSSSHNRYFSYSFLKSPISLKMKNSRHKSCLKLFSIVFERFSLYKKLCFIQKNQDSIA